MAGTWAPSGNAWGERVNQGLDPRRAQQHASKLARRDGRMQAEAVRGVDAPRGGLIGRAMGEAEPRQMAGGGGQLGMMQDPRAALALFQPGRDIFGMQAGAEAAPPPDAMMQRLAMMRGRR